VPRRQDKGSVPSRQMAAARLSAFLLVVVVGVLAVAQPANAATTQTDVTYLNAAHQSSLTIIQAAQDGKAHGRSSCVRQVSALMERDHRKLAAQELEVAGQLGVGLVTVPSLAQREKLEALAAKAGTSGYDDAWLVLQRQEHQQLLKLIEEELATGTEPAVKSVAKGAQPVVEMHLRMVAGPCRVETGSPIVPTGDGGQMADAERIRSRIAVVLVGLGMVLLLFGKQIRARRRLLGVAALGTGLLMAFGELPGDTGEVPAVAPAAVEREAAIPPVRLALPGFVNAPVQPVATGDGRLQMPKSPADVGWWAAGAAPGSAGGTVLLAGHVDSVRHARGVFAALSQVPVGAKVAVTAGDGGVHRYRIVARRTYRQEDLPADLFHGASKPRLALVTCIGSYDRSAHRYSHNLVLYGVPLD
jgi:predicted outer membrane protein